MTGAMGRLAHAIKKIKKKEADESVIEDLMIIQEGLDLMLEDAWTLPVERDTLILQKKELDQRVIDLSEKLKPKKKAKEPSRKTQIDANMRKRFMSMKKDREDKKRRRR